MTEKLIRDAVLGDIAFDPVETAVLDSRPVQRLRTIKQLGAASLVYPSATHTRFEHSLGTAVLAKRILALLKERGWEPSAEMARAIPLAALLHDVTHWPFGHTFEDERRLFDRHDEDPVRLEHWLAEPTLAEALARSGVAEQVKDLLWRRAGAAAEVVSGVVGADLLDYLRRDAYGTGLPQVYDERVLRSFVVAEDRLAVGLHKRGLLRHDVLSELVHLLRVRYNLTERVYYHHAKTAAGAMVSRALEAALAHGVMTAGELNGLGDESLLVTLRTRLEPWPMAANLADGLLARRLHKRAFQTGLAGLDGLGVDPREQAALAARYHYSAEQRAGAEADIAARLGVNPLAVLIYCPAPTMQLKESTVPVVLGDGQLTTLDRLHSPEVASLSDKYRTLWRLMVCVRPDLDRAVAGRAAESVLETANLLR